jgi:hypothetical protein
MTPQRVQSEYLICGLDTIDFQDPALIASRVADIHRIVFPDFDTRYIGHRFHNVVDMFEGRYPGYMPMDTAYHDLEHTMQTTYCLFQLLLGWHRHQQSPTLAPQHYNIALITILLHDIGYLKEVRDFSGSGAKYTHVHEQRSCRHAREYLSRRGWSEDNIQVVERLISCTGPRSDLTLIHFESPEEAILGQAICTADFIGQMSDPRYVEKLPDLYREFLESYEFQGLPLAERPFLSYEDMLQKTPGFWETFVHWKMQEQCGNIWRCFKDPDTGLNIYLDAVQRNIEKIRTLITAGDANHSG